jgi:hypothetical protein
MPKELHPVKADVPGRKVQLWEFGTEACEAKGIAMVGGRSVVRGSEGISWAGGGFASGQPVGRFLPVNIHHVRADIPLFVLYGVRGVRPALGPELC